MHQAYSEFIQEYEELGHMNQINEDTSNTEEQLLPSTSCGFQKFQAVQHVLMLFSMAHVVFDDSCCSSNRLSLNDSLLAGPQLLSASLRQQYWILRMKQVIRSVLHCCLPCFKLKAAASQ